MKHISKLLYIVFVFLILSYCAQAQSPYIFHHLKTNDGLSNDFVKTIIRDSYGFLWVGTESGLNRYDGYVFKVYSMPQGISNISFLSNDILDLQEDGNGNIWIGLVNSYVVYNRDKDCFHTEIPPILQKMGINVGHNYKIYIDKQKNLWVLSNNGIFYHDIKKKQIKIFYLKALQDDISRTELNDGDTILYFIQNSGNIWQMNKNTGLITSLKLPNTIRQDIANNINKIYVDSYNGLWLYSSKTDLVFYKKNATQPWKKIELNSIINTQSDIVRSIIDDQNGCIWIGTDHKGLFIYDKSKDAITNILHNQQEINSLSSNNVSCMYRDNNGSIWLGHDKKGLSVFHESFHNFINIQHSECNDISTIFEDYQGNLWLGTDGNGLYLKTKSSVQLKKLPIPNTAIMCMLEDKKGRIWIGTYLKGLFCFEKGKMIQYTTSNSKLSSNNIWRLKEDRYGSIWIGTLGGKIHRLQFGSNVFESLVPLNDELVYTLDMFYDGGDKMYVGTAYGLNIIDISTSKQSLYFGNKQGSQNFKRMLISSVYKDEHDFLWLGSNHGLTIWDLKKDTLYYFDKENGLCDNTVRCITADHLKNIWVTTSNGMSILHAEKDMNGKLNISCRNFSTKDGLKDNYFNNHSFCNLRNGDILLGTTEGYTLINPNKMAEKSRPMAKVILTELLVENQIIQIDSIYNGRKLLGNPLEKTDLLTFKYSDKLICLQFTTNDLLNSDKVKFLYTIEGFNSQWILTQENKIVLSALPPGKYKLLIKACNSDGVWSNNPTEIAIKIAPPFYNSAVAYILYCIVIIWLLFYYLYRVKTQHEQKLEQQKLELDHEKELHIREMKLRFFTNISHDLRTPLTLIITPLQILLNDTKNEHIHNKLQTIYQNAEQLLHLINSLLDFRKLDVGAETLQLKQVNIVNLIKDVYISFNAYATERKIKFSLLNEMESLQMQFDPDKIHKSLTNLLSNAFKYTPDGGAIDIHIYQENDKACISVTDSGTGIKDEEKTLVFVRFYQAIQKQDKTGSGIGLHIASEYVKLHGGSIHVTDNHPQGCVFTIKLPISVADDSEDIIDKEFLDEDIPNVEGIQKDIVPEEIVFRKSKGKQMLLFVDDNKEFCEFMSDNLATDYEVITAYNGQEALVVLKNTDINIIVTDVMMPVMSGTELCKQVKTNLQWSHIPVIMLTARTAEEYKLEGLELGADDYITKPFNYDLLKLRIRKFIEWAEKSHIAFSQKLDVSPSEITITSLDEKFIEKAINVVEEHISDAEFSVEILGEAVGLSRSHLYKKLIIITGKGPAEFIRTIRLKRGRQLLEKSQLQIAEIAYSVGFNSPKRFTKNFRDEFGITPSDYLRQFNQAK